MFTVSNIAQRIQLSFVTLAYMQVFTVPDADEYEAATGRIVPGEVEAVTKFAGELYQFNEDSPEMKVGDDLQGKRIFVAMWRDEVYELVKLKEVTHLGTWVDNRSDKCHVMSGLAEDGRLTGMLVLYDIAKIAWEQRYYIPRNEALWGPCAWGTY
jgi:hypothetical protein